MPRMSPQRPESDPEPSSAKKIGSWFFFFLIIPLFAGFPVLFLIQNIEDSSGTLPFKTQTERLGGPKATYYGNPVSIYSSKGSDLCITFGFIALDPATPITNFAILFDATQQGANTLKHLGRQGYNTVLLEIRSNVGLSSINLHVPFSALEHSRLSSCENKGLNKAGPAQATAFRKKLLRYTDFRVNQSIFVLGQPRSFPNDWYELDDSITAYAIRVSKSVTTASNRHPYKELPSSLLMMSRDEDFSVNVALDGASKYLVSPLSANFAFTHLLMFTVTRSAWVIIYTYLVAAMPFMLLMILGLYQYRRRQDVPKAYEVAFGVTATMVAILPLHAVLVPSSLPSLTRLDIVFSTEVAFLVGLSIIAVAKWTTPGTKGPPPPPAFRDEPSDSGGEEK
jgi:hypothetical protein